MKKLILASAALLLFSCAQEDSPVDGDQQKASQTVDHGIGYKSPFQGFNYSLENVEYSFTNTTDLKLIVTPHFGLAYCDGDTTDLIHFGMDLVNSSSGPNQPGGIAPQLTNYGELEHGGGYVKGQEITVASNSSFAYDDNIRVSLDFVLDYQGAERSLIHKQGKLFFYEVIVLDNMNNEITRTIVKSFFPVGIHPNFNLPFPWKELNKERFFNEWLVYNGLTGEVCLTSTNSSDYIYRKGFYFNGINYVVGTEMSERGLNLYLRKN